MKRFIPLLIAASLALPAASAEPDPPGLSERLLEDFLEGTEEALREMLRQVEPELQTLLDQLRRLPMYEAPEILPNGDIIIRRKRPTPGTAPADGATEI